jgi:hypothetical protein
MHTAQIVIAINPLLIAEFGHLTCLKFEKKLKINERTDPQFFAGSFMKTTSGCWSM